jgi:hypothetical protein
VPVIIGDRNKPFHLIWWACYYWQQKQTFLFDLIATFLFFWLCLLLLATTKKDFLGPDWQQKQTILLDLIELELETRNFLFDLIVPVINGNRNKPFSLILLCLLLMATETNLSLWFYCACYYWQQNQTSLFDLIVPVIIGNISKPFSLIWLCLLLLAT